MKSLFNTYKERQEKLNALGISYRDYLLSDEWKSIKTKVKNREGRRWNFCNICGADKNLDLHHSSYKVLGQEHPGNTIKPLCRDCHNNLHEVSKKNPTWRFRSPVEQERFSKPTDKTDNTDTTDESPT